MLGERNFPDFIESYLKYSSGHESTKKIHMWTAISILAGALERKVWMDRGYYTLFPNLYVFIIGKSGLIKKSTSTNIGIDLLREVPGFNFMSERLTSASLIEQLSTSHKTFEYKERIINQSATFAYASELSILMMEVHGTIIELLTTFYDCQPNDASKPWVYKTRTKEPLEIYGPCLNILGASTTAWLERCIPKNEMEGGFTGRCIFVVEKDGPEKFVAWPEYTAETLEMKSRLVEDLMMINELKGQVVIHPKTKEYFTKWYNFHMKEVVTPNKDPRFTGYLSRKGDLLLKLAMVRSASLRDDLYILPSHLEWAGKVLQATEKDMFHAFDKAYHNKKTHQDESYPSINTLNAFNLIKSRDKISVKKIRKFFGVKSKGGDLGKCLSELVEMGRIDIETKGDVQYFFATKTYAEKVTNS